MHKRVYKYTGIIRGVVYSEIVIICKYLRTYGYRVFSLMNCSLSGILRNVNLIKSRTLLSRECLMVEERFLINAWEGNNGPLSMCKVLKPVKSAALIKMLRKLKETLRLDMAKPRMLANLY